jgi:hypothetical protein
MFALVKKLVADFYLQKDIRRVHIGHATRLLMLPSLLQVYAVAGTVERHFALLATALRANATMDSRTEAFLLALSANRTAHGCKASGKHYDISAGKQSVEQPGSASRVDKYPVALFGVDLAALGGQIFDPQKR